MNLLFQLVFRKSDGADFMPTDAEQKAMMLLKGGHDMKNQFQHVGNVSEKDIFEEAVKKIVNGLQACTKSSRGTFFYPISHKVQNCLKDGHKKSATLQG